MANILLASPKAAGEAGVPPNTSVSNPGFVNRLTGFSPPPSVPAYSLNTTEGQAVSPASS